jgi:hypothetical protein
MDSLYANIKAYASLVPAVRTADANGSGVDTLGYSDGMAVISVGDLDLASTDETYAFTVEESDDNSSWSSAISGLTASATADNQVKVIALKNLNTTRKRYLRVSLDVGGTTPSCPVSAIILLGAPASGPVN